MAASKKPRKDATDEGNGRARPREATGDSLNAYIREIAKFKPLQPEEEKALGVKIQQGDQEALRHLVECNLRFVVAYAKRYRGLGLSYLDLIHEGTLGLMEAAKRFRSQVKGPTYASSKSFTLKIRRPVESMYVPKFSACRSPWIHTREVRSSR